VRRAGSALLVAALAFGLRPASADEAPPAADAPEDVPASLDERTKAAVAKGLAWLRKQADKGDWGPTYVEGGKTYNGGTDVYEKPHASTALALYTLLKCGVPDNDPLVRRGFDRLRKKKLEGNAYELSMKLLAVTATADPFKRGKDSKAAGDRVRLVGPMRTWATELVQALVSLRSPHGWRYWGRRDITKGGPQDLSSTQLAALALFAAERCGIEVDPDVWVGVLRFTLAQQEEDGPSRPRAVESRNARRPAEPGETSAPSEATPTDRARGFAYIRRSGPAPEDRKASGGMTACGIASLMLARFSLSTRAPAAWAQLDGAKVQTGVYDGLAWLDAHWHPSTNPPAGDSGWHLYYVYCVERAMDLVGGWRLGKRLWYVEMAEALLPQQKADGSWNGLHRALLNGDVLDTCFALLFLQRATKGGIPFPSVTGGSDEPPSDNR
jgi:hypothetical protein